VRTGSREQVAAREVVGELALPLRVQEELGELVSSAKEGLPGDPGRIAATPRVGVAAREVPYLISIEWHWFPLPRRALTQAAARLRAPLPPYSPHPDGTTRTLTAHECL
jgi:hypothetical protein